MFPKMILAVILAVALIGPVIAVKQCYSCEHFKLYGNNATNNEKCWDVTPDSKEFLVNCTDTIENPAAGTEDNWQCGLVRGKIEREEGEKKVNYDIVIRSCIPGKVHTVDCKNIKSYQTHHGIVKRGSECICDDKDGCNSGNSITFGVLTISLGLLVSQL